MAQALDFAHKHGVLHRDVKPSNLVVDESGKAWVTDFGLARIEDQPQLTVTGALVGTLRYMSPEQAMSERVVVDHRTDIYSLGVTLYELLTLRTPFIGDDKHSLLQQITSEEPHPPRHFNRSVPIALQNIVMKAIAKNPNDRYVTAKDLADDLQRFLDGTAVLARPRRAFHGLSVTHRSSLQR